MGNAKLSKERNKMMLLTKCRICSTMVEVEGFTVEGFQARKAGAMIQDAFPEMSASHREMLISNTCPKCWDEMWLEDEE